MARHGSRHRRIAGREIQDRPHQQAAAAGLAIIDQIQRRRGKARRPVPCEGPERHRRQPTCVMPQRRQERAPRIAEGRGKRRFLHPRFGREHGQRHVHPPEHPVQRHRGIQHGTIARTRVCGRGGGRVGGRGGGGKGRDRGHVRNPDRSFLTKPYRLPAPPASGIPQGTAEEARMSLPHTMTAMEITAPGGPDVLQPCDRPVPVPGHGQIVIRIAWAGVNRPDALQRAGAYAPPPGASPLPGLEAAGHVVAMGQGVARWQIGDAVCALLPGGGYAEYAVCAADHALPIPAGLSLREAACLPETCFTVWSNLVMRGGLQAGERFLVHGGSSGIGTTAIQIARALGARVFATAGSPEKCLACEGLGAEAAIDYRTADFVELLKREGGANLILDMVGGPYLPRNLRALADDGRLVQIAFLQGPKVEVNFAEVMVRRLTITGSTLRPQSDLAKARIAAAVEAHVWPMIAAGHLRPVMDSEFRLVDAAGAHRRMESSAHVGKIVLKVGG